MNKYNYQRFHSAIGYKKPMHVYLNYMQNYMQSLLNKCKIGNKIIFFCVDFSVHYTKPMLGFKSFRSATITGIENIRMIQKRQMTGANNNFATFEHFVMLMAS